MLTPLFHRALADAEIYHHVQTRKSTSIPYVSHLLAVCSLVLEAGGSETEAIAALLHDAVEDAGGGPVLAKIERDYGAEVAAIVDHCSDAAPLEGEEKPPWLDRKQQYIERLRSADASTLLVSAADKLHNLRSIQDDYLRGEPVFARFSAPDDKRTNTLSYYQSLYDVYIDPRSATDSRRARLTAPLGAILDWFRDEPQFETPLLVTAP